ncbi:MAG: glycerol-3-phosphate acyltransferase, partial [Eggerthellaceae bacterium]
MLDVLVAVALFATAFLLGSIPFGLIISKVFYHTDIREHGSGNIGTTNAIRTIGKVGGALVFVLDFGKGLLSGWLAAFVFAPAIAAVPVDAATSDGQLLLGVFGGPALNPVGLALALA